MANTHSSLAAETAGSWPPALRRIRDLLTCPRCSEPVSTAEEGFRCLACEASYPVRGGIVHMARPGTAETWSGKAEGSSSDPYQEQYRQVSDATRYNEAYRDRLFKRKSTQRENELLRRLLGSQRGCATLLDLPSGGGRLSPLLERYTDLLIEADIAVGQLLYEKEHTFLEKEPARLTASAFHIPFLDDSIDGTVCIRLCHHLPTETERERLVVELLRVSRRFAVMTFFDYHSWKNLWRRARRPLDHKPPKMTMTVRQVSDLARRSGAELVACPALSPLFSGHRYALMVKRGS